MTRVERLATARGLTVQEYLLVHSEYRLSRREKRRWRRRVLELAARLIEEQHQHVHPAR